MEPSLVPCQPVTPAKRSFTDESAHPVFSSQMPQDARQTGSPSVVMPPESPRSMGSNHKTDPILLPNGVSRQPSPALSSLSSLSNISSTLPPFGIDGASQSAEQTPVNQSNGQQLNQPVAKRRKLTPSEIQQRKVEKEIKQREKAEQKAKKEEEKQVKDEERRQKNEIKEEKKREKDLEKQRKEEEKRKIEEEKEKKERAQKRINSFFAKPKEPIKVSDEASRETCVAEEAYGLLPLDAATTPQTLKNDYRRTFLPFALPSNTVWAPASRFSWDEDAKAHIWKTLDQSAPITDDHPHRDLSILESLKTCAAELRPRGIAYEPVRDIIKRLTNSESDSSHVTNSEFANPLDALQRIPMRYLHFHEDVRPPYVGTYTKIDQLSLARTSRNPFRTPRVDTDYEYDSEAEWEEPDDDGEDLQSEGESELESNDGVDDMDDFLDDENADVQTAKKKAVPVDLEPVSSGLCWECSEGVSLDSRLERTRFGLYRLALLQDSLKLPIDPFSSSYWEEQESEAKGSTKQSGGVMQPPRQPLQSRPNMFLNAMPLSPSQGSTPDSKPPKPPAQTPRLLAGSELEEFKQAVSDSEHTKVGLLAILKKQFPKVPKTVLSDTLSSYAERQGRSEAEKRWKIKDTL